MSDEIQDTEDTANENTVYLKKPIKAGGETIKKIVFDEPTGGDIIAAGHPVNIGLEEGGGQLMVTNTKAIGTLISRMGNIPLSSVKSLAAKDFQTCTNMVISFFGDAPGAD